ncbi:helix-turn-helix domain-containing protein [Shewanella xiamenensis]|uniref:helix-turn-helix domain-containing protein n=1 Tax=Shewanella xiamenensis TaxID=332186 RepID=UPI0024A7167B|nr:helix-turn-helix transcriptional regulator [Shewanella xiamenensis]MDI5874899.1 helix-turn-helix domain-containing protein [Shewanella xiamenensis]
MKTSGYSPFPTRMKEARRLSGLSQKQLGLQIGLDAFVASTRMNRYEKGVHFPDYGTARAIAAVLNVPTAYLFCEDDDLALKILEWGKQQ